MSDLISGIRQIGPTYPVKPVSPIQKDREPGERHKKETPKPEHEDLDDDDKPTIDELV